MDRQWPAAWPRGGLQRQGRPCGLVSFPGAQAAWPRVRAFSAAGASPAASSVPQQPPARSVEDLELKLLEDSPLRWLAYLGRYGRVLAASVAKGSRYIAYTSDVGEAFRPVLDERVVKAGYAVAIAYVVTEIGLTTHRAQSKGEDVKRAFAQVTTFQMLGSLIVPSIVLHTGVSQATKVFIKVQRFQRWGPSAVGLAMIPFMPTLIDEPIEHAVHSAFDAYWPTGKPPHKHE
jgi:fission process protein 1